MYKFTFAPDSTNFHPWDSDMEFSLQSAIRGERCVYATNPSSPDRIQTYWVSETVMNKYQDYLQRFELTEVELSHEQLVELGAKLHF